MPLREMTLREMIDAHPDKFYPQTWYDGEAFMDTPDNTTTLWPNNVRDGVPRFMARPLYRAVDLAQLWLRGPTDLIWSRYLWTSDTDSQGQRVYVGQNGKGLEIHRHLHLTERWGVPV